MTERTAPHVCLCVPTFRRPEGLRKLLLDYKEQHSARQVASESPVAIPKNLWKKLVAIGGITLERAAGVIAAGASVLAVAGALFRQPDPAAEFRKWMSVLS